MKQNLLAVLALLAPSTNALFFGHHSPLLELDIDIQKKPEQHHSLMQLHSNNYIDKDLDSFHDIQILSKLYIGSHRQAFDLIFDTGSSWVWVGTDMCKTCANPEKFFFEKSTSFKQKSSDVSMLAYVRGMVLGYDSTDQVCLTKHSKVGNGCMEDYLFKSVVYQE